VSVFDVVVVGAGIVGAACAWECTEANLRVAVVDAGVVGGEATAAGMGHIVIMDGSEAEFALTRYSQHLWNEIAGDMPDELEYRQYGTIWVAADDRGMKAVRQKQRYCAQRNVRAEALDERQLAEAEPNLREGLAGGLLLPGDSVIYPPCAAAWFLEKARQHGAQIILSSAVREISDDGVELVDGSSIPARNTINATGVNALLLTPAPLSLRARKGHLAITDRYPGFLHHQLIELGYSDSAHSTETESIAFNVQPRATGQLLIGSSRQFGVEDPKIEDGVLSAMLDRAVDYMPALQGLSVLRAWTGFRAATPDHLPFIGLCPGYRNVYLATGHEGLGVTTSLATARLLADQLSGRESAISAEPFSPERFLTAHA
jgi:D-hydroxyproline dehydrogenase subunit beta